MRQEGKSVILKNIEKRPMAFERELFVPFVILYLKGFRDTVFQTKIKEVPDM